MLSISVEFLQKRRSLSRLDESGMRTYSSKMRVPRPSPLLGALLAACVSPLMAMSLSQDPQRLADGSPIRRDRFTKLLIDPARGRGGFDDAAAIARALERMRGSHCALRAVGRVLESGELKGLSFGRAIDSHANYACHRESLSVGDESYSFEAATIVVNEKRDYLRDTDNLAKVLYHEGLHHIECTRLPSTAEEGGCRPDGMRHHNPLCVRRLLAAVLPAGDSCLSQVGEDGTLYERDGGLFEPRYAEAVDGPDPRMRGAADHEALKRAGAQSGRGAAQSLDAASGKLRALADPWEPGLSPQP